MPLTPVNLFSSPPLSSFPQVEQEAFDLKTELRAVQEQCRNERDQIESNDQVGNLLNNTFINLLRLSGSDRVQRPGGGTRRGGEVCVCACCGVLCGVILTFSLSPSLRGTEP